MIAGETKRNLGFLEWEDPLAPLEDQESDIFHSTCRRENKWHTELMKEPKIQKFSKQSKKFQNYLDDHRLIKKYFKSGSFDFDIDLISSDIFVHLPGIDKISVIDFAKKDNIVALLTDNSDGYETYTLQVYKVSQTNSELLWQLKEVGETIGFAGDMLYYTKGNHYHIYDTLYCVHPLEKARKKAVFKIKPTEKQSIIQTKAATFLHVIDYAHKRLYKITKHGIEPVRDVGIYDQIIGGEDHIYYDISTKSYKSLANYNLPQGRPLWYSAKHRLVQTIQDGVQEIWSIGSNQKPQLQLSTQVPGDITIDPFADAVDAPVLRYMMCCVDREPLLGTISATETRTGKAANGLYYPRVAVTKIKPQGVPAIIVKMKGAAKPTNLLVYCYGSYGSYTVHTAAYQRFWPLLQTGHWCIAYAMVRGGGDCGFDWIHAGRKFNKLQTVDDFETVIRAVQEELGIDAAHTAIYGRSAGGIPTGLAIARNGNKLFKAAWMEAPFVDMLRSLTDLSQPLSLNESEEFGNPADGPAEFKQIADISPIDNIPSEGIPNINIILRTGTADRQVYAFEPLKFAQRLRGADSMNDVRAQKSPAGIYVFCGEHQGHFYSNGTALDAKVEDMAALDFWLSDA